MCHKRIKTKYFQLSVMNINIMKMITEDKTSAENSTDVASQPARLTDRQTNMIYAQKQTYTQMMSDTEPTHKKWC